MSRIAYLEDQIARADRLSRSILDTQTLERLHAYAAECRRQLALLRETGPGK